VIFKGKLFNKMEYKIKGPRIVIVGAGNVAFHFSIALHAAGYDIVQVYNRTLHSAELLAINHINEIDTSSDVLIFALNDNVLSDTIGKIKFCGQLALHTSGSLPIDIFSGKTDFYGVIYPLQTLSKSRQINMKEVPLLIEANSSRELSNLMSMAKAISARVIITDSLQRRQIHLSAVFASNFVNHMYVIANDLMKKSGFSYELLKPIILETAMKALEFASPMDAQTGPAVRMNKDIIEKHKEMLSRNEELQQLYTLISNHITKTHHQQVKDSNH
jgi:predicted short-subunit dehydrogenase-like oxidoreductase (DUF2520 family)